MKNIGLTERKFRFTIGLTMIFLSVIIFFANQVHIGLALFGLGLLPLFTSLTGTCPFYCAMRHSSAVSTTDRLNLEN